MAEDFQLCRDGVEKRMIKSRMLKFIAAIFLISNLTNAQFGFDKKLVSINVPTDTINTKAGEIIEFNIEAVISEGWHINSDKPKDESLIATTLELHNSSAFEIVEIKYPKAKEIKFDFSPKPISVFEKNFFISCKIKSKSKAVGKQELILRLNYQACNNASCMPPNVAERKLIVNVLNDNAENSTEVSDKKQVNANEKVDSENSLANQFESSGLILSLFLVFLGGLALNLTPCVYPLIPITIGYFGGQSEGRTSKLFLMGVLYVLGMAFTYSVIGVATAMSGAVFGTLLQNPIVIIIIALIFVTLSLSMFGVYEFKLPDSLVIKAGGAKSGMFGAFLMGLTMGIVAAPCIGPFVLGLLTFVAAKADIFLGFLMFFFLALGLGTPYLVLAVFSGKIKKLPRAGFWMDGVKHIFGFLLLGMALYFLGPLIPKDINKYVLPVFMTGVAVYLIFFDKLANDIKIFRGFKIAFSLILFAVAVYWLLPGDENSSQWQIYSDKSFSDALGKEKIIIDFYADWCIPCKELDAMTFSDKKVIQAGKSFVSFKVDMTKTMDDETERIRKKFNILGMPTILIFNRKGEEVERITGFIDADSFQKILSNIN
jgi:thiol:disulfide interchange protein DsbD